MIARFRRWLHRTGLLCWVGEHRFHVVSRGPRLVYRCMGCGYES